MDCASETGSISEPGVIAAGAGALPGARRRCEAGKRTHGPGPRACLALLATTALLALAAPAQAQTAVLISNFNQAEAIGPNIPVVSTIQQMAQGFTTGSSPATLTSIDLKFYAPEATTELPSMTLHSGSPTGTQVAILTSSGSLAAMGRATFTFTAPANTTLTLATTYFLVLENTGSVSIVPIPTKSDAEEIGGATGWSIADVLKYRFGSMGSFTGDFLDDTMESRAVLIRVNGTVTAASTTAPGAPTGLAATATGPSQIDLAWTAPASTGGSAITGYKIEVSANGTSGWTDQVANTNSTATTYAHTGLTAGDTRHYRVSAINTNGAGDPSNVDSATTDATAPGAPTGLTATASGATAINLSWTAPGSTGGSAITGYKIEVSANGTSGWTDQVADTNSTTTTYAHTGLTAGDTRHYRVSAINTNGAGDPSNVDSATTGTTVPGAPTGLTATASGTTAINLSWSAPASTGGSAITGYKIEVSANGTSGWTDQVADTNSTTTTYAHTGLTAGDTRHYRVSAINTNGAGDPSNVDSATTGTTVPGAPTGLTATASGRDQPLLERPGQHRRLRHHRLQDRGLGQRDLRLDRQVANTNSTATTYAHTGHRRDTRHYRVSAINTNGAGASTAPPRTPPPPAPRPGSRPRPAGPPRSTSPGAPRPAPAAPPSPATRSRSRPTGPPAGPTRSPTPTAPPPPTRTPG